MKGKTFYALLLSLVMVAGAMTINDAFAQTNTERLITVIDTTADTNAKVSSLVDLWADFDSHFTPIMSAIDDLSGDLSMVSDKVSMVSDDVMSVNSKISAFESKFDAFVAADAEHAEDNKMNYDSFAQMLPEIQGTVDQIAEETNTSLGTVSEKLEGLEEQIGQFTSTIEMLQGEVGEIKTELGLVQSSVEERVGPAPVDLRSGEVTESVMLSWYTQGLTSVPSNTKYSANFMFVCESDVFVQTASTTLGDLNPADLTALENPSVKVTYYTNSSMLATAMGDLDSPIYDGIKHDHDGDGQTDVIAHQKTTLKAGSQTLFMSQYDYGDPAKIVTFNRDANFNLMELKAGNALQFTSTVQDDRTDTPYSAPDDTDTPNWKALEFIANTKKNTAIAANVTLSTTTGEDKLHDGANTDITSQGVITKSQLKAAKAYEVTVDYFSAVMDPKCIITPSKTAELDKTDQVTFVSHKADSEGALLTKYSATLGCDLNPTKINSITGYLSGADGFNNYVTMELMVGKEKKGEFTFTDNVSTIMDEDSLPIEFHGEDLTISGSTISGASLLVEVRYDTVANGECSQQ